MRSILYRFPDLKQFERLVCASEGTELELGIPSGEVIDDGEWVLAVFELGQAGRATSAAARASVGPEGARVVFEPRDWRRLAEFAQIELRRAPTVRAMKSPPPPPPRPERPGPNPRPTPEGGQPAASAPSGPPTSASLREHPSGSWRRQARSAGAGARILIVDDDPDIREVVAAMLEAVGLVVVPVGSAEEALERVRLDPFDLLVFDWNLPKMTGIELCRLVRKEPGLGVLPVLFLTANASSQDMVEAFASGADDYVVKPFRAPELGARIFSLLRRSRVAAS